MEPFRLLCFSEGYAELIFCGSYNKPIIPVTVATMPEKMGLDYWVQCLSQSEMLALSNVITEINDLCASEEGSAAELAELILQDASLTSKVLQVANSVYYKPNIRNAITTVSRAVVLLGFSGIKSILILTMLLEHVLQNGGKKRMLTCLAKALHRAAQAKFLAAHVLEEDDELLEEIFVYGLVYDLAEIAFWGRNNSIVANMEQKLTAGADPVALQKALLGASFKQISCGLVKRWKLGTGLEEVFFPKNDPGLKAQAVLLADEICCATEHGWGGQSLEGVLPAVSRFIGINKTDTRVLLKDRADWAFDLATSIGAEDVARFIPATANSHYSTRDGQEESIGDSALQLEILREINAMNGDCLDINALFHMLLEAAHRGIGLNRVGVFIVNKSSTAATLKYAVGQDVADWDKGLQLPIASGGVISSCVQKGEVVWLKPEKTPAANDIQGGIPIEFFDAKNALIASIRAGEKTLALIVSDCGKNGRAINNAQYESYCFFSQQASRLLSTAVI